MGWRCSTARGPVQGPGRLHSYLQNWGEGEKKSKTEKKRKGKRVMTAKIRVEKREIRAFRENKSFPWVKSPPGPDPLPQSYILGH